MLIYALGALILLVLVLFVSALFKPDTFRVERSALIAASPETLFPLIADFHQWTQWSPWEGMDPAMTRQYSGEPSGTGAVYEWAGPKVGAGRMEILDTHAPDRLHIRLDFTKPFEAHNEVTFSIEPEGSGSRVQWAMYGPHPLPMRMMSIVMSMDKMVGGDFEKGLAGLKSVAESGAR